jgi:hypothetical protein
MKYLVLLLVLLRLLIAPAASSQPADVMGLQLSGGISVPLLDYASNDLSKGSFTQPGLAISATIAWNMTKAFSTGLETALYQHPVDVSSLGAAKVLNDPFLEDLYIRSDPYRLVGLFPQLAYGFLSSKKVNLSVIGSLGPMWSRTPYQLYKPRYFLAGPPYYEITESRDLSLAYGMGVKAAFRVNPYVNFLMSFDMKETHAAFKFLTANGIRTDKKRITMLNINAGLYVTLF